MNIKELDKINLEFEDLRDSLSRGEITKEEYEKKHEELNKKITSFKSYRDFNNKKEFIKESRKIAKNYSIKFDAPIFKNIVEKEIKHEIEHSIINDKYNLPSTFGFFCRDEDGWFQSFICVKNINKLTKNWSTYKYFKYEIEGLTYPEKISHFDKESLKRLKERIKLNKELKEVERGELLNLINLRL